MIKCRFINYLQIWGLNFKKNIKMKNSIYIFIVLLFGSCAVYKPDSGSLTSPDYDQRVQVSNAHYDKVLTPIGVGSFLVGTAAGGYLGYTRTKNSNYFAEYNGTKKDNFSIAGGVLGAFSGYTLTYLLNKAVGWGNYKSSSNPNNWIKNANKNFLLVRQTTNSNFTVMHKSAESIFTVKNIQDARDFSVVFKNSSYQNRIIDQGSSILPRTNLIEFINIYSTDANIPKAKFSFLDKSNGFDEILDAKIRYPIVKIEAEPKLVRNISTVSNLSDFKIHYPNSSLMNEAILMAMNSNSSLELPSIISLFNKSDYQQYPALVEAEERYIKANQNSLTAYLAAVDKYPNRCSHSEVEQKSASLVSNYQDAKMFKNRFGKQSKYSKEVFLNALRKSKRKEILSLITLYNELDSATHYQAHVKYVELSETIYDCLKAVQRFKDVKNIADKRAYDLVTTVAKAKNYLNYFRDGSYEQLVKEKMANYIRNDYNKLNSRDLVGLHYFVKKYEDIDYDPYNILYNARNKLNEINRQYERDYDRALEYSNNAEQLVLIFIETESWFPAFTIAEQIRPELMKIDNINPWVNRVYLSGAKGNKLVYAAEWYKKGTQESIGEGLLKFGISILGGKVNMGDDLDDFNNDVGSYVKYNHKEVTSFNAYYYGSHSDDIDWSETASYDYETEVQNEIMDCKDGCALKEEKFNYHNESYNEDHYDIYLKNGTRYDICYDYASGKWEIEVWLTNETGFESKTEVINKIIERCKTECDD